MKMKQLLFFNVVFWMSSSVISQRESDVTMQKSEAMLMLKKYHYLGEGSPDPEMKDDSKYSEALEMFQEVAGLNMTGTLDQPTMKKMKSKRCGLPDFIDKGDLMKKRRRRRYVLNGNKWLKGRVGYNYVNGPTDSTLSSPQVHEEIDRAFKTWADVANLDVKKMEKTSDIQISFVKGDHGDGYPLDDQGGILGHAFFPGGTWSGDVHFDAAETWTAKSDKGTDLYAVALHEIGHSLGLQHSLRMDATMYPYYPGYKPNPKLSRDDIDGIVAIYGIKEQSPMSTPPPRPSAMPPMYELFCENGTSDAIGTLEGKLFAFQGSMYAELDNRGVKPDFPKRIDTDWASLENDVDAVLPIQQGRELLVFKESKYWRFSLVNGMPSLTTGYPRNITDDFRGDLPDEIDAAFVWSRNGETYIISGGDYYRVRMTVSPDKVEARAYRGYPKSFSKEWGVTGIHGAFVYDGRTFFLSGENYYRYNDFTYRADAGYPMKIAERWFGCQPQGSLEELEMYMMKKESQFSEFNSDLDRSTRGRCSLCKANILHATFVVFLCVMYRF